MRSILAFSLVLLLCLSVSCATGYAQANTDAVLRPHSVGQLARELPPHSPLAEGEYYEIEVLFLYSPETLALKNGLEGVQTRINEIVNVANETFRNSGSAVLVTSKAVVASPMAEIGDAEQELHALSNNAEVKALRETHQADIVSFLVSHNSNDKHCGNAFLLQHLDSFAQDYGFQVISFHPVCEKWVFTHELGHNLGAAHDKDNAPEQGLFSDSYGYRFSASGKEYRTVMAFAPGEVINYYSSPTLSFTGSAIGSDAANNAGTIEMSMGFVAAYRGGSTRTVEPTVSISKSESGKQCTLTVAVDGLVSTGELQLFAQKKKKASSSPFTSRSATEGDNAFFVKRSRKTKKIYAVLTSGSQQVQSETVTCKRKKR